LISLYFEGQKKEVEKMKNKLIIVLLLIVATTLIGIPQASANPDFLGAFNRYYSTANPRLNTCVLCHGVDFDPWLNPYGLNISGTLIRTGTMRTPNFSAIESIDSDGDGYTNIQEINAGSFPGNALDFPFVIPNMDSSGKYLTGFMVLPRRFDGKIEIVDIFSITFGVGPCQGPDKYCSIKPDMLKIGDFDKLDVQKMFKLDRNKVLGLLSQNGIFNEKILDQKIDIRIMGRFLNKKTTFEGHDTIRVIYKGK
jgi:hypothetical protein